MNKKVITLCAAALLFGGAGVNGAYAASVTAEKAYTADNAIKLTDGVKVYLKGASNFLVAEEATIEGTTVLTLGAAQSSVKDATPFEIRNCKEAADGSGVTF